MDDVRRQPQRNGKWAGWHTGAAGRRRFFAGTQGRPDTLHMAQRLEDEHHQVRAALVGAVVALGVLAGHVACAQTPPPAQARGPETQAQISKSAAMVAKNYGDEYARAFADLLAVLTSVPSQPAAAGAPAGGERGPAGVVLPQVPQPPSQPFTLEIGLAKVPAKSAEFKPTPVADGDTLTQDDHYKVTFRPSAERCLYVIQVDQTGKCVPIFPSPFTHEGNPVRARESREVPPAREAWFFLDANAGEEVLYFMCAQAKRPDVEALFKRFEDLNSKLRLVSHALKVEPVAQTRGIGGIRPGGNVPVSKPTGQQSPVQATAYESASPDLVVIKRWFIHK